MKKKMKIAASVLLLSAVSSQATVVAWNFREDNTTGQIGAEQDTASLDAAAGWSSAPIWNQPIGASGTNISNGISVTWNSNGTWRGGGSNVIEDDASQRAFFQFLDDQDGGSSYYNGDGYGISIQLSGLQDFLTANSADAYRITLLWAVHRNSGPGSDDFNANFGSAQIREGNLPSTATSTAISELTLISSIAPNALYGENKNGLNGGNWPTATSTAAGSRTFGHSDWMSYDEITIALPIRDPELGNNTTRYTISGFAIEAIPEPTISLLGGLGALVLLRRRR